MLSWLSSSPTIEQEYFFNDEISGAKCQRSFPGPITAIVIRLVKEVTDADSNFWGLVKNDRVETTMKYYVCQDSDDVADELWASYESAQRNGER